VTIVCNYLRAPHVAAVTRPCVYLLNTAWHYRLFVLVSSFVHFYFWFFFWSHHQLLNPQYQIVADGTALLISLSAELRPQTRDQIAFNRFCYRFVSTDFDNYSWLISYVSLSLLTLTVEVSTFCVWVRWMLFGVCVWACVTVSLATV